MSGAASVARGKGEAEAWVSECKAGCVQKRPYPSFERAEQDALDDIGFHDDERLHQALGDIQPAEYEALRPPDTVSPVAARRQATTRASGQKRWMEEKESENDAHALPSAATPGDEGTEPPRDPGRSRASSTPTTPRPTWSPASTPTKRSDTVPAPACAALRVAHPVPPVAA